MKTRRLVLPDNIKRPVWSHGWTFVETMVVIGIILILTASVGFMAFKYIGQAKTATARSQVDAFSMAIHAYNVDMKSFPTADQGLKVLWDKPSDPGAWNGPYVSKEIPMDPWGNPYGYKVPGPNNLPFEVISLGADGQVGGEGDGADVSSAK